MDSLALTLQQSGTQSVRDFGVHVSEQFKFKVLYDTTDTSTVQAQSDFVDASFRALWQQGFQASQPFLDKTYNPSGTGAVTHGDKAKTARELNVWWAKTTALAHEFGDSCTSATDLCTGFKPMEGTAAFWSGGIESSFYGRRKGRTMLEVSGAGFFLDSMDDEWACRAVKVPFKRIGPLWNSNSKTFAESCKGEVLAFMRAPDTESVLARQEYEQLAKREKEGLLQFSAVFLIGQDKKNGDARTFCAHECFQGQMAEVGRASKEDWEDANLDPSKPDYEDCKQPSPKATSRCLPTAFFTTIGTSQAKFETWKDSDGGVLKQPLLLAFAINAHMYIAMERVAFEHMRLIELYTKRRYCRGTGTSKPYQLESLSVGAPVGQLSGCEVSKWKWSDWASHMQGVVEKSYTSVRTAFYQSVPDTDDEKKKERPPSGWARDNKTHERLAPETTFETKLSHTWKSYYDKADAFSWELLKAKFGSRPWYFDVARIFLGTDANGEVWEPFEDFTKWDKYYNDTSTASKSCPGCFNTKIGDWAKGTRPVGWEGTSSQSLYGTSTNPSTLASTDVYDIIEWKDQSSQRDKAGTKEAVSTDPNKRRFQHLTAFLYDILDSFAMKKTASMIIENTKPSTNAFPSWRRLDDDPSASPAFLPSWTTGEDDDVDDGFGGGFFHPREHFGVGA